MPDFRCNFIRNFGNHSGFRLWNVSQPIGMSVDDKTARHLKSGANEPSETGPLAPDERRVTAVNQRTGVFRGRVCRGRRHLPLSVPTNARNPPVSLPTIIRLPTICGDESDKPVPAFC